jgi:hypothetical protein
VNALWKGLPNPVLRGGRWGVVATVLILLLPGKALPDKGAPGDAPPGEAAPVPEAAVPSDRIREADAKEPEFVFFLHDPERTMPLERVAQAERRLARRRGRVREALGGALPPGPPVHIHLHPTVEAKGLATEDMSVAHAPAGELAVHLSLQSGLEGDRIAMELLPLLRATGEEPTLRAVEMGAVVLLSDDWLSRSPTEWVARAHRAGLVPPLREILDDVTFDAGSRLLLPAVGAVLVEWLLEEESPLPGFSMRTTGAPGVPGWEKARGWARFGELHRRWRPTPAEIARLEERWVRHLDSLTRAMEKSSTPGPSTEASPLPSPVPGTRPDPVPGVGYVAGSGTNFQRGFNFAHEGYRIHDGFGSARAAESLDHLASLGTNAVAVLPYTFLAAPGLPGPFRIPSRPGSENDEAVTHAILAAQDRGMAVMLKPHIWLRGSWAGEIRMSTEADWDRFFIEYARWIGHYALLAEARGVESLCLGTELSAAALERPNDWRRLAHRIRQVYSGRLGYCANWGEEVESLAFWDAVDFIGVSFYYPLSSRANPSERELRRGADRGPGSSRGAGKAAWATSDPGRSGVRQQPRPLAASLGGGTGPRCPGGPGGPGPELPDPHPGPRGKGGNSGSLLVEVAHHRSHGSPSTRGLHPGGEARRGCGGRMVPTDRLPGKRPVTP